MPRKRKKIGRPRTGRSPMIGLRLDRKLLRKIDAVMDALRLKDRSTTLRYLLKEAIESKWYFVGDRRRKGVTGGYVQMLLTNEKAKAAEKTALRAPSPAAELKALRAREKADALINAERDRLALAGVRNKLPAFPTSPRGLTEAQIKAAADRAEARSQRRN